MARDVYEAGHVGAFPSQLAPGFETLQAKGPLIEDETHEAVTEHASWAPRMYLHVATGVHTLPSAGTLGGHLGSLGGTKPPSEGAASATGPLASGAVGPPSTAVAFPAHPDARQSTPKASARTG